MKKVLTFFAAAVCTFLLGGMAHADTLAAWEFTSDNYANYTSGNSSSIGAHTGTGTLVFGSTESYTAEGNSTAYGCIKFTAQMNGELTPEQAIVSANHKTWIQAGFSTAGYKNPTIAFGFAADAGTTVYVVYSTDGGTSWQYDAMYTKTTSGWSTLENFTGIVLGASGSENVLVRILPGTHGNGKTSGDIYFDNFSAAADSNRETRTIFESDFSDWTSVQNTLTTIPAYTGTIYLDPAGNCKVGSPSESDQAGKYTKPCILDYKTHYLALKSGNDNYVKIGPVSKLRKFVFVEGNTGNDRGSIISIQGLNEAAETPVLTQSVNTYTGSAGGVRHTLDLANNKTEYTDGGTKSGSADFTFTDAQREEAYIIIRNWQKPDGSSSGKDSYFFYMAIDAEVEITAEQVTLTTEVSPAEAGSIKVSPNTTQFDKDSEITLTQTANFGYCFVRWEDGNGQELGTDAQLVYTISGNSTIKAIYEQVATYSLTMLAENGKDYMLGVTPEGTTINGQRMYEAGTDVQVVASSGTIFSFLNWEDGTTNATRNLTINANTTVTATFSNVPYIVGWDFYQAGNSSRPADMANETTNTGMLVLRKADGATTSWLDKSALGGGPYEGRYAAVNWKPFNSDPTTAATENYYYEANFSTKNYSNITLKSSMSLNYNAFSVQKVQYSIDGGNTFKDLATITIPAAKTWVDQENQLPAEAENIDKLYIRWIPDYTSPVIGTASANDGTAIADIYVLADHAAEPDYDAPVLLTTIPEADGENVSAKGSIILNFDEQVIAGTGDCTLNGEVLDAKFAGTSVIFAYSGLDYATRYTFTVPAGAITDRLGNAYEGTEFSFTTMERTQPTPALYDAVVAQDGSGDYTSLADAISAAPENRTAPWLIFLKAGTYREHIDIPANKPYIHLIGQDKMLVTVTDSLLCGGDNALHVSQGATVVVNATDFYAENITFDNKHGVETNAGPQALAMFTDNDRATFYNCRLRSYQDTYLTSTNHVADRHYLKNCWIEGAVDFIYGGGDVYFDECTLNIVRTSGGYIVAPSHHETTAWGYVFMNNTITAPTDPASSTSVYLGRPWQGAPKTVFLNTISEVTIPAVGWYYKMGAIPAIFADYNTMDANGNPVDLSNRIEDYEYEDGGQTITGKAKNSLTDEEAAQYTYKNVLSGTDGWNPRELMESAGQPQNVSLVGTTLSWDAMPYARCYVIFAGDKVVGFTTANTFTVADTTETYYVKAANEYGSLSDKSKAATSGGTGTALSATQPAGFTATVSGNGILLGNLQAGQQVDIFAVDGKLLYRNTATGNQMSINLPVQSVYVVKIDSSVLKVVR